MVDGGGWWLSSKRFKTQIFGKFVVPFAIFFFLFYTRFIPLVCVSRIEKRKKERKRDEVHRQKKKWQKEGIKKKKRGKS